MAGAYAPLTDTDRLDKDDGGTLRETGNGRPESTHSSTLGKFAETAANKAAQATTTAVDAVSSFNSGDLDARLRTWRHRIAQKIKRKRRKALPARSRLEPVPIIASVFEPAEPDIAWQQSHEIKTLSNEPVMTQAQFNALADAVREAIAMDVQPRLNAKGSSGSYFARNLDRKTLGIFKPKDEEPYGAANPKWTKWVHRKLGGIIGFGRACLIPGLSYVTEEAASVLDRQLGTHIVPRTEVIKLSSPSFFYDWIDRNSAKGKHPKPLPLKPGSFQVFVTGYTDATVFLKEHPWPGGAAWEDTDEKSRRHPRHRLFRSCRMLCGRAGAVADDDDEEELNKQEGHRSRSPLPPSPSPDGARPFAWTPALMQQFREELEKLVILDYLMRNTDRGTDNFMLRYDPPAPSPPEDRTLKPIQEQMSAHPGMSAIRPPSQTSDGTIHLAAIDNSLAFPHEHPKGWRNYTYGWLWLPASLIGMPFSEKTRKQFLPLLSSPAWWAQMTLELRKVFSIDEDFNEKMFKKQMAVIKGQAWNVVQSLSHDDEGPLELCRRSKILVWDDEIEVSADQLTQELIAAASTPNRQPAGMSGSIDDLTARQAARPISPVTAPMSRHSIATATPRPGAGLRTQSHFTRSPPPKRPRTMERMLSGPNLSSRPIPAARRLDLAGDAFGGATGIAALEHMERLQREEQDLQNAFGFQDEQISAVAEAYGVAEERASVDSERQAILSATSPISKRISRATLVSPAQRSFFGNRARSGSTNDARVSGVQSRYAGSSGGSIDGGSEWAADGASEAGEIETGRRTVIVERLEPIVAGQSLRLACMRSLC
ncbi:uncharacterized protein L969DRAFT_53056 [Mixia osmundae IAM 14324]|uniref:Phosphatidylinositol 4-kinase n=1 Tax=Mixia osmundae (strain CBS 9802 / IAM 14324 / JCM 22182 / KY 12970) TaxID=764103 RepID=G7DUS5_MIXOS|nr:uncharacterized protein L969DRAFT_53056 [Mixia osmundae IAM 14324]KEI37447.1 hypothetical protein L969DRAFT_53056 [Mixia osmundae IAM 14324]GAA94335.1 hypothetical protein E5Q_00986 [Mixia osmundae IAM 14324]